MFTMKRKQNNFYLRWQQAAKSGRTAGQKKWLRTLAPGLGLVAVCLLGWGVLTIQNLLTMQQFNDVYAWCQDNSEAYLAALSDQQKAEEFRALTNYTTDLNSMLDSYPEVTNALLARIEAAGSSSISIEFTSYDASSGVLNFNAHSSEVIDIPTYIRSLQNCGVFSSVTYTGYSSDDGLYSIDLRCVLAAPQ